EVEAWFTPYYCDGFLEMLRKAGLIDFTILGRPWRADCVKYLQQHALPIDYAGAAGNYDLVVTCSDLVVPRNVRKNRLILVQEGMTDPEQFLYWLRKILRLPLWASGTSGTGLSRLYDRFCVASPGYRDLFVSKGAPSERIVVTGIPNFDDCARYRNNTFDRDGYVLVCTSDTRETLKRDNRKKFIARAVEIAAGRPMIFKLHPNENWERNSREIRRQVPDADIHTTGCAEEMVANCDVLIVQYSTLAYVGLALNKEVHAYADLEELRHLLPLQGGMAARNIAHVCRQLLHSSTIDGPPTHPPTLKGRLVSAHLLGERVAA
ncbi:MAG: hypothetical protein H7X95_05450, partial [Deltaproteobacteria bacterium]|nr:hypothetical protein [Deltaproteobacteria bacterium]